MRTLFTLILGLLVVNLEASAAERCDIFANYHVQGRIDKRYSVQDKTKCFEETNFAKFKDQSVAAFEEKASVVANNMMYFGECADRKYIRKEVVGSAAERTDFLDCYQTHDEGETVETVRAIAQTSGLVAVRCCYKVLECPPN